MFQMYRLCISLFVFSLGVGTWENTAQAEETTIEVNVYKIFTSPLWHSGIVIDGVEYFFNSDNRVTTCSPGNTGKSRHRHHRKMQFTAPHSLAETKRILSGVIQRWDGSRYDVAAHNCNRFVDDVLNSLHAGRLDKEYLKCSGIAQFFGGVPGGATLQEALVKAPMGEARMKEALKEDWSRIRELPADTKAETQRFARRSKAEWDRFRKRF